MMVMQIGFFILRRARKAAMLAALKILANSRMTGVS